MKLIEALKKKAELLKKAEDLRKLIALNCALSSIETPKYDNQRTQVDGWLQAHTDILKEWLRLSIAIQRTNLVTQVEVEVKDGQTVSNTIAEWIHRRHTLCNLDRSAWQGLTDRNIREGKGAGPSGTEMDIRIVRFYSPDQRDKRLANTTAEPSRIDAALEIVNALTDLVD